MIHIRLLIGLLLAVSASALAQPGGWDVDATRYQYSMTAVVQIKVDGVPNHLLSNQLAMFWRGQIRGYAAPVRINDQAFFFLNLYSNVYKDDTLRFLAYIGADQAVYESSSIILFRHHKAMGKIAEPLVVNFTLGARPIIYSLSEVDYAEGSCNTVLDVQTSDNQNTEGNGLTYNLLAGGDAHRFHINPQTGLLSWRWDFVPDFEMPADVNGDNRYEVRVRVTDASGLAAEQNITVTVKKTIPPLPLACPQNQSVFTSDDGRGNCSSTALGTYIPTASACLSFDLSYQLTGATTGSGVGSLPVSQTFEKGVTTVTYTQTGSSPGQCSFTVTVTDAELPTAICPFNIVRNTDPSACTAIVTYSVGNSDNCSGLAPTLTDGLPSGSAFPKGMTLVNWKVTDGAGLTAQCGFTVTVNDNLAPTITCPANIVRSTDANLCTATVNYTLPTAADNCGTPALVHVSGGTSGAAFSQGITVVQWKATDGEGLSKTCTFTVTVNDAQAPNITCPTNITSGTSPNLCAATVTYTTPTASDNCSGATSMHVSGGVSGSVFPKGQTTVVWRATDAMGLTKTCSFRITVNDTQAPTITCPGNLTANTTPTSCVSAPLTYTTPTATDNCTPPPTVVRIIGPGSGSTFPRGSTFVTWRAIDGSGRSSTCSFSVTVTDVTPPTITCPQSISVTAPPGQCSMPVTYTNPTATDNCSVQSVFLLSGLSSGSTFPQGTTLNTWRAVDNSGRSSTCSFSVTVGCGTNSEQRGVSSEQWVLGLGSETPNSELQTLNFKLCPNPAMQSVEVLVDAGSDASATGGELAVSDVQGRLMYRQSLPQGQDRTVIEFGESWPNGLYLVTFRSGEKVTARRLVVARL